jgi:hypothetical protein
MVVNWPVKNKSAKSFQLGWMCIAQSTDDGTIQPSLTLTQTTQKETQKC